MSNGYPSDCGALGRPVDRPQGPRTGVSGSAAGGFPRRRPGGGVALSPEERAAATSAYRAGVPDPTPVEGRTRGLRSSAASTAITWRFPLSWRTPPGGSGGGLLSGRPRRFRPHPKKLAAPRAGGGASFGQLRESLATGRRTATAATPTRATTTSPPLLPLHGGELLAGNESRMAACRNGGGCEWASASCSSSTARRGGSTNSSSPAPRRSLPERSSTRTAATACSAPTPAPLARRLPSAATW